MASAAAHRALAAAAAGEQPQPPVPHRVVETRRCLAGWVVLFKRAFRALVHALPDSVRYLLTLVAFWPTALANRFICWAWPHRRQLWNRVSPGVILGAVPLRRTEMVGLAAREGVRGVVNLCKEWNGHAGWYPSAGLVQLHLPTIDFDVPRLAHCLAGARFIRDHAVAGATTYVHCKAGRGRSHAVVLCYLVLYCGMTPDAAEAAVRRVRPHVSSRAACAPVQHCAALVSAHGSGAALEAAIDAAAAAAANVASRPDGSLLAPLPTPLPAAAPHAKHT